MIKKFFLLIVLSIVCFGFLPVTVAAQDIPAIRNPVCWSKNDCENQIKNVYHGSFNPDLNWLPGGPNGECGSMGACIPAGKAQLSIKIGGSSVVSNLGDYIKTVYIYLIGIGGIVAVVLILKGGFEYVSSAGSPERVTSAKSTITSALIGLFLLLGSYTMLYTINPDLLQLKLPRVFMLRTITLGTDWCKDQPSVAKLALAKATASDQERKLSDYKQEDFKIPVQPKEEEIKAGLSAASPPREIPICGATYFSNSGSAGTCNGHVCKDSNEGKKQLCIKKSANNYACQAGNIGGTVTGTEGLWQYGGDGWLTEIALVAVCSDGYAIDLTARSSASRINNDTDKSQNYIIDISELESQSAATYRSKICDIQASGGSRDFKGFALRVKTNGKGSTFGRGLIIGKSSSSQCNTVLAQTQGIVAGEDLATVMKNLKDASADKFISADEAKSGIVCDIKVNDQMTWNK
jgi:hypothetical protein